MNRRLIYTIWLAVLLLALTPAALFGQTEKGAIVGTVTDSQGAAIPGAAVTITNLGTNVGQTLTTNAEGLYEAPFLTPGVYKVSAASTGFATSVNNNVVASTFSKAAGCWSLPGRWRHCPTLRSPRPVLYLPISKVYDPEP